MSDKLIQYSDALRDFVKIHEQIMAKKQKDILEGKYINVFTLWNEFTGITEPIHSRILQFILSPHTMHGQENRFINLLLKRINVNYGENDEWISTAETGRVVGEIAGEYINASSPIICMGKEIMNLVK